MNPTMTARLKSALNPYNIRATLQNSMIICSRTVRAITYTFLLISNKSLTKTYPRSIIKSKGTSLH